MTDWAIMRATMQQILRGQKRHISQILLKDNIIIGYYIRDNIWTSEKNNKIHVRNLK